MRTTEFDSARVSLFRGGAKFLSFAAFAFVLAAMSASPAVAQDEKGGGDLATAATNPVGALIQLQFQDQFTPESQNATGYANTAIVQPVIPISLGQDGFFQTLVTRTTLPVAVTTANPAGPRGRTTGTGDTVLLVSPTHSVPGEDGEFFTWGPLGTITFPTATQTETGAGKFQAGPGGVVLKNFAKIFNDGDSLMLGGLGYQQWSFAGEGSRQSVSKFYVEPIAVYHFKSLFGDKGWYARLPDDLWIYDFKIDDFIQIPVGAAIGRVFPIGKQPVNLFLQSWYNAAEENSSQYTVKLNLTFLFPK